MLYLVKRAIFLTFAVAMSAFWSLVMLVWLLVQFFKHGLKLFERKVRSEPPEVLVNDWNHDYVQLKKVKLHYVHAGSPDKPLMVMLHGFPEFWYSWRFLIRAFQNDYRVVAVDQRGYTTSDQPSGFTQYALEELWEDIAQLIPALGYKSCVLVGHDWGGAVAFQVALRYQELVDRLIIFNAPHPAAFGKLLRSERSQMLKSWYMFYYLCPWLPEFNMCLRDFKALDVILRGKGAGVHNTANITDQDIEAWKYTFSSPASFTNPINYIRAAVLRLNNPKRTSSNVIQPPVLILWGDKDRFLESKLASMSAEYCRDCTVHIVDGASHWLQQDEPQLCIDRMRDWLVAK